MPHDPDHKVKLKPHITLCPKYGIRMQIVNTKFFKLKETVQQYKIDLLLAIMDKVLSP
jgi:hypothetical protein